MPLCLKPYSAGGKPLDLFAISNVSGLEVHQIADAPVRRAFSFSSFFPAANPRVPIGYRCVNLFN